MPYTEDDAIISYQIRNNSINSLEYANSHLSFTNQTYSGFFITIVNSYNVVWQTFSQSKTGKTIPHYIKGVRELQIKIK